MIIKRYFFLLVILSILNFYSCKQENKANPASVGEEQETPKNISELTYPEIFFLLHDEDEYGMDVHGDLFGQDAVGDISLVVGDNTQCGDAIFIKSSHSSENIKVAVKTTFNFPGNPANEIFRAYVIKPGESLPVGHSLLCYQGTEYPINREIASAGFTNEE